MTSGSEVSGIGQVARESRVADLRVALGLVIRRLREESQSGELTWSQAAVLSRLDRDGPSSVTELATAEGIRPQSLGASVAVLEQGGLIAGSKDPRDGRRTIISITEDGRATLQAERALRENWLDSAITTKLSPAEQEHLLGAASLIRRLLEP